MPTGLVGRALLQRLLSSTADPARARAAAAAPAIFAHPKLELHVVDFAHLRRLPRVDDVYIALGTTIQGDWLAGGLRRVDHDHVIAIARAAMRDRRKRLAN